MLLNVAFFENNTGVNVGDPVGDAGAVRKALGMEAYGP
jgi:hypothetical protein